MIQQTQQSAAATNEFDAAKVIVETLKDLDPQQQARAIRFACETLGLHATATIAATTTQLSPSTTSPVLPESPAATPRPQDIKRFAESKAPKTDQQFAAVVAYFYCFEVADADRKDAIDAKILENAFRLADRKRPGDYLATLNNAKNSGYLDAIGRGKFKISTVGENLVAMTLPGSNSDAPLNKAVGTRKRRKKKAATKRLTRSSK